MSVCIIHHTTNVSITDLVTRAFEPTHGPTSEDIVIKLFIGPPLAGRSSVWWQWTLREGVSSFLVPGALNEPDTEEDAPYPCRSGLIARPDGSSTAYVAMNDEGRPMTINKLAESIVQTANWAPTAPR
jgi:hypothetical protein